MVILAWISTINELTLNPREIRRGLGIIGMFILITSPSWSCFGRLWGCKCWETFHCPSDWRFSAQSKVDRGKVWVRWRWHQGKPLDSSHWEALEAVIQCWEGHYWHGYVFRSWYRSNSILLLRRKWDSSIVKWCFRWLCAPLSPWEASPQLKISSAGLPSHRS